MVGLVDKERWKYSDNIEYFVNKKLQYLILRGEFELTSTLKEKYNFTWEELFSSNIYGFGINSNKSFVKVTLYKISWY